MDAITDLVSLLSGPARAIVISEKDVDLRPSTGDNRLFVLRIGEGSSAAGGRGGGFGERKVTEVSCFELKGGNWTKRFEVVGPQAESFEVPFYVSRLPMTMADGTESMGYGVVEKDLVQTMLSKAGVPSSP